MTSTREKGASFVREARDVYEALGFQTWSPGNKAIWIPDPKNPGRRIPISQSQDIAELFDLLAWRAPHEIHFVQVKKDDSESTCSKARLAIDASGFPYCVATLIVLNRVPRKKNYFTRWIKCEGEWKRDTFEMPPVEK